MRGAGNPTVAEEHRFDLPVAEIAEVWRRGSVLSSWLIDLTARASSTTLRSPSSPGTSRTPARAGGP